MLNEFLSLLTLFADAATMTQSENVPSLSIVTPTISAIYYDLFNEQSTVVHTSVLCSALLTSLVYQFGDIWEQLGVDLYRDGIFLYAPFRDARFKLHWIVESSLPLVTKKPSL